MKIKICNAGGFGNRIYAWETMYEIAKINNAELESDFPELEYITLPNTTYTQNSIVNEYHHSYKDYLPFNSVKIYPTFKLADGYNYYATCGFGYHRYFDRIHEKDYSFPKQQMKLKDNFLSEKIKNITSGVVGVHMRRGEAGVGNHTLFDPKHQGVTHYPTGTIPDFWYYSIMSQIKEYNPNIKFYLSTDDSRDNLNIFYDNFDIISNKDLLSTDFKYDGWKSPQDYEYASGNNLIRGGDLAGMIDLFSLSSCNLLICSVSSWSMTAYEMGKLPTIWPEVAQQTLDSIRMFRLTENAKSLKITDIL